MATPAVLNAQDLWQPKQVFGIIKTLSLIATSAVILALKAVPRGMILTHVCFDNFSVFPPGSSLPSTLAASWGTDVAGTNMAPSAAFGANAIAPFCLAQRTDVPANAPYCNVGQSVFFQLTTGVAAAGTCDVTFVGSWLP